MHIVGWILFGLLVGVVAGLLVPGRNLGDLLVTALLGIAGAVVGGVAGRMIVWSGDGGSAEFVTAVAGALAPLVAYRFWMGRTASV